MKCFSAAFLALACLGLIVQDAGGQTDQTDRRLRHREKQRYRLAELARASSDFGMKLYRQIAAQNSDNIVFSPFSVFSALSMTLLGTEGETKAELKAVMSQRPRQGVHRALRSVVDSFPRSHQANVTLRVGNAMYYDDQRITLNPGFLDRTRRLYGASPQAFERPDPEDPINQWIERATGGKIKNFLNAGDITDDTVLMLLNAVYFQGTWKDIFDERMTREQDFTTATGSVVRVRMMSRDGQYSVKALDANMAARVLELPFGTDDRFSLFVFLPDEVDGLARLESYLDDRTLENAMSVMPVAMRYDVSLPRFKLRQKSSMKRVLQALGLSRIFTGQAQLARMSPSRLKVNDIVHEAVIEVDEKGATAAAVTGVSVGIVSLPPQFRVDRPFLLVLRDKKARINLFLGRVANPTQ